MELLFFSVMVLLVMLFLIIAIKCTITSVAYNFSSFGEASHRTIAVNKNENSRT